jgi:hypothetical protein
MGYWECVDRELSEIAKAKRKRLYKNLRKNLRILLTGK